MIENRYPQEDICRIRLSACTLCGGHHDEIPCPRTLSGAGYSVMDGDQGIFGKHILAKSQFMGLVNNAVVVTELTPQVYGLKSRIFSDSHQFGLWADEQSGYLRSEIELTKHVDNHLVLDTSVLRTGIKLAFTVDTPIMTAQHPNEILMGGQLSRACEICGSVHAFVSCPHQIATLLHGTYGDFVMPGLGKEVGVALQYNSWADISQSNNPLRLTGDQNTIHLSKMGLQGILPSHPDLVSSLFDRVDVGFGNGVGALAGGSCGSFHMGQVCPGGVTLTPREINAPNILSSWLLPERVSPAKAVMHSWREWLTAPVFLGAEFGDYLAARVRDAVCDVVASHSLVEGDLIVQVAILVQAESGAITQIGRISSD